jgi:hypothetical protein
MDQVDLAAFPDGADLCPMVSYPGHFDIADRSLEGRGSLSMP